MALVNGSSLGLLTFPWVDELILIALLGGPRDSAGRSLTCCFASQRARRGWRVKGRAQPGRAAMRNTLEAGEARP